MYAASVSAPAPAPAPFHVKNNGELKKGEEKEIDNDESVEEKWVKSVPSTISIT